MDFDKIFNGTITFSRGETVFCSAEDFQQEKENLPEFLLRMNKRESDLFLEFLGGECNCWNWLFREVDDSGVITFQEVATLKDGKVVVDKDYFFNEILVEIESAIVEIEMFERQQQVGSWR